jgi:hypothetical protein
MTAIFLSYRRLDTGGYAGRLTDALQKRFGEASVFQDIEAITPGADFEQTIDKAIARCDVLLVLIGNTWTTEKSEAGGTRLSDPHDFLRLEVASAIRARKHVLPVLVEGAHMPAAHALPEELEGLTRLQALELSDSRWVHDVDRLVTAIRTLTGGAAASRRRAWLAMGVALLAPLVTLAHWLLDRPPDLAGRWNLPNGSFWIVTQEGQTIAISETHYDSKQVWKRGVGDVSADRVQFTLDLVHGAPRRYEGRLRVSSDNNTLSGEVRDANAGTTEALALTRAR